MTAHRCCALSRIEGLDIIQPAESTNWAVSAWANPAGQPSSLTMLV